MIDGLMGHPYKGTEVFVCRKCGEVPVQAFGADEQKRLVHLLVCPKCFRILGEWPSVQAKDAELQEFATKVRELNKPRLNYSA